MKRIFLSIIATGLALYGSSQYLDTEQPDSVYKLSRVKKRICRYDGWGLENCIVNSYDSNGKITEQTMFDKSGKKYWLRTLFEYDSSNKLVKEFFYSYINHDKVTGQDKPDSILGSSKITDCKLEYDSLNRLVKITGTTLLDKSPYAVHYYYNPLVSVAHFRQLNDSLMTIAITTYETPKIVKSYFSSHDSAVVTKNAWRETYKNIFDQSGKIIERINETPNDPSFCSEIIYEYNSQGLLVKRVTHYRGSAKDCDVRLFDYEYRDDPADLLTRVNVHKQN